MCKTHGKKKLSRKCWMFYHLDYSQPIGYCSGKTRKKAWELICKINGIKDIPYKEVKSRDWTNI